jgi:D-alanyl-D-alanine carboxypeptidase
MEAQKHRNIPAILLSLLLVATLSGAGYLFYRYTLLTEQHTILVQHTSALEENLDTTNDILEAKETNITELETALRDTEDELIEVERDLRREENKNEEFEDQIRALAGTVGELDRVSQIDKELLQKYSKVYFLSENYRPARMSEIPSRYILEGRTTQFFLADAMPFLTDMLADARRDDIELSVLSAFRSFEEQNDLKGQFTQTYGQGANAFSADQGYSEHQLGTTVDITTPEVGGAYTSLKDTEAFEWLQENAHEYGFILSYPEGNGFYVFEPWHWRFVGRELATDLHQRDILFYEMDQI